MAKKLTLKENIYGSVLTPKNDMGTSVQTNGLMSAEGFNRYSYLANTPTATATAKKEPLVSYEHAPETTPTGNVMLDEGNFYTNYIGAGSSNVGAGSSNVGADSTLNGSDVKPYSDYFAEQKKILEDQRKSAMQEAKLYEERATADAQGAYAQNKATYGMNAEQLAQMGLTGGGYGDYLNAQAYAQKRSDIQQAGAKRANMESQAQATYSAGIAALNKEQADLEQAKQDEYVAVLADLQNATNYANYTEDGIIAIGNQKGWTKSQVDEAVKVWNAAKSANEIDAGGSGSNDATQYSATAYISAIQNGQYAGTREELYEACLQNRNAGYMTDADVAEVMKQYDNWEAYKEGKVSADVYYDSINGDTTAQGAVNNAGNADFESNSINTAKELLKSQLNIGDSSYLKELVKGSKVIDINTGKVELSTFNSDAGDNDKQQSYWNALKADLSKVAVGQYIMPNYGGKGMSVTDEYFLCVAPGIFVSVNYGTSYPENIKGKVYLPDGYKLNSLGQVRKS